MFCLHLGTSYSTCPLNADMTHVSLLTSLHFTSRLPSQEISSTPHFYVDDLQIVILALIFSSDLQTCLRRKGNKSEAALILTLPRESSLTLPFLHTQALCISLPDCSLFLLYRYCLLLLFKIKQNHQPPPALPVSSHVPSALPSSEDRFRNQAA